MIDNIMVVGFMHLEDLVTEIEILSGTTAPEGWIVRVESYQKTESDHQGMVEKAGFYVEAAVEYGNSVYVHRCLISNCQTWAQAKSPEDQERIQAHKVLSERCHEDMVKYFEELGYDVRPGVFAPVARSKVIGVRPGMFSSIITKWNEEARNAFKKD